MTVSFEQLWAIAQQVGRRLGQSPQTVFSSIGLILEPPKRPWTYFCTPKNVLTFASTGHDGIHYSLLVGSDLTESPVVMTVPMNFENPNMVISETLHEFLCLGCRLGYRRLDALAEFDQDYSLFKSLDYGRWFSEEQRQLLTSLNTAFNLYPYMHLEGRMARLQAKYLERLQLADPGAVATWSAPVPARRRKRPLANRPVSSGFLEIEIHTQ